jgi:hypothetical protein
MKPQVKTKSLIAVVAITHLAGQVVTFFGGIANTTGSELAKFPCECAWAVLAFPLGWLGFIGGSFAAKQFLLPFFYLFLWTGVTMNSCLWGWIVYGVARVVRGQCQNHGFDSAAISARVSELRQSHGVIAHARSRPLYARKGFVAMASRSISRCGFFAKQRISSEAESAEGETRK